MGRQHKNIETLTTQKVVVLATAIGVVVIALIYILFVRNPVVTKVSQYEIRKSDVKQRHQVNRIFYPQITEDYGQENLTTAYVYAQILANHGMAITEQMLRYEENRIDTSTKDPKKLAEIKALFKGDLDAYRRNFILPTLVEQMLPNLFARDRNAQEGPLKKAEEILQALKHSPRSFDEYAKTHNLSIAKVIVSAVDGVYYRHPNESRDAYSSPPANMPRDMRPTEKQPREATGDRSIYAKWFSELKPLKVGDIVPTVFDLDPYYVVSVVEKKDSLKNFQLKVLQIPKIDFNQWLEQEKAKVKIQR